MSCTKRIPKFKSLRDESDFWDTHSPLDFDEFEEVEGHFIDARPAAKRPTKRATKAAPRKARKPAR